MVRQNRRNIRKQKATVNVMSRVIDVLKDSHGFTEVVWCDSLSNLRSHLLAWKVREFLHGGPIVYILYSSMG